jgi:hypothetical protein
MMNMSNLEMGFIGAVYDPRGENASEIDFLTSEDDEETNEHSSNSSVI